MRLQTENIYIIKIGTNVLISNSANQTLDLKTIENICNQISSLIKQGKKVVMITSGAVGAGLEIMPALAEEKNAELRKRMLAAIGSGKIIKIYNDFFKKHGIHCAQILVERRHLADRTTYLHFRDTLQGLLKHGVVPILNENDVITDLEWKFGENDMLATITAITLKAKKLFLCTDVDGLYTDDPRMNEAAEKVHEVKDFSDGIQGMAKKSSSGVGMGGMISKMHSVKLATQAGIEAYIISGKIPNNIIKSIEEKNIGTKFFPQSKTLKNFQRWLRAGAATFGAIVVDNGAVKALQQRKSLLMVGIVRVEGNFSKSEIVNICSLTGEIIATGMTHYSSKKIRARLSVKENYNVKEVVHADNLVLVAENLQFPVNKNL